MHSLTAAGALFTLSPDVDTETRYDEMVTVMFPARMATLEGVLGVMGAVLAITEVFGIAAHSVSNRLKALGAQRREVLRPALGRAVKLLAFGSGAGVLLGVLASWVLAHIVFQATPRDPLVLAGVVLGDVAAGIGGYLDSGTARSPH